MSELDRFSSKNEEFVGCTKKFTWVECSKFRREVSRFYEIRERFIRAESVQKAQLNTAETLWMRSNHLQYLNKRDSKLGDELKMQHLALSMEPKNKTKTPPLQVTNLELILLSNHIYDTS